MSTAQLSQIQWIILTAALALVSVAVGWNLYSGYQDTDANERKQLSDHANVISQNVAQQLRTIDITLDAIRHDLPLLSAQGNETKVMERRLAISAYTLPGVRALLILDATGRIVASNREELIGLNSRGRDYFAIARAKPDRSTLHVTAPYKNAKGVFSMTLSKAILDSRGAFAGVVATTFAPEYFNTLLQSVLYAPDMRASIVHGDGIIFLNLPPVPGLEGMNIARPGTFFTKHMQMGEPTSVLTGTVFATGDKRMLAQRTLSTGDLPIDKPIVIATSRDLDLIFSNWRRNAHNQGAMFGLLVLISTIGLYFYQLRQAAHGRVTAAEEERRMKVEDDLRQSEARFRSLTEMASDFYWETDSEHRFVQRTLGSKGSALVAMKEGPPIGLRPWELPSLSPDEAGWQAHRAVLDAHLPFRSFEVSRIGIDGETWHTSNSGEPIFDSSGAFKGYRGVGSDITERKRAEAEIFRMNTELELQVQQRTRELLIANAELESFAHSVSHDLRAPLRAIEGFSNVLAIEYAAQLDERGNDYFRRIRNGATRMAGLIDDMLKLSRVSRQKLNLEPVDLSELVKEAAEDLHSAEPERHVEWEIAPRVTVMGDRGLLLVAVQNLIGNAWKYSSKGKAARIEFGVADRNGKSACFVSDNGAGFDMAYADKLFGAFQRLHSPSEFPGTGIGLATVKRVIHRHGGEVWAEGEVGMGARFYFAL